MEDVRQAFLAIDSQITEEICGKYLQRAFGLPGDKLKSNVKVEKNILIKNLQTGSVQRVSERPA